MKITQMLLLGFPEMIPSLSHAQSELQTDVPELKLPWGIYQASVFDADLKIYLLKNVRFGAILERFGPPSPPSWENDTVQPVADGRNCIQVDTSKLKNPPGGKAPLNDPRDGNMKQAEDCLFLDIYAPFSAFDPDAKALPVVVWIYGGAFAFGSKDQLEPLYTGQSIITASDNQTIFVVGNYRLGAFGWLAGDYMQKAAQPNAGLYDQALLLEWVQEYVGQVGGDKNKVSVWGESAGASSILHHLIREDGKKDPLFRTFIAMSPAFEWAWDNSPGGRLDEMYKNFSGFTGCGCEYDIACLRQLDIRNLTAANQRLFTTVRQTGLFPVGPAVDGEWVKRIPTVAFSKNMFWQEIDSAIISHCGNEAGTFLPKDPITDADKFDAFLRTMLPGPDLCPQREAIRKKYDCQTRYHGDYVACITDVIRDSSLTCNTRDLFNAYPNISYMMEHAFPYVRIAFHARDLVTLFINNKSEAKKLFINAKVPLVSGLLAGWLVDDGISSTYQNYFASFALSGNPNERVPRSAPFWPHANGSGDQLSNVMQVRHSDKDPFVCITDDQNSNDTCSFWTDLAASIMDPPKSYEKEGPDIQGGLYYPNEL
ncbi:Alpha/Beta hydrolase protein [Biscogniauxia marginata]|nr:Alpha/Beta hydrolase protein [Biscogniauxia marginata]